MESGITSKDNRASKLKVRIMKNLKNQKTDVADASVDPVVMPRPELRSAVIEIFERREYSPCWYSGELNSDDPYGDCANWTDCPAHCPLVKLRDAAGIDGRDDGSLPSA